MSEQDEQKAIVAYYRAAYPKHALSLRVSQSGAARGAGRRGAIRTTLARSQGQVKGEADICILVPRGKWHSLLIEHKTAKGVLSKQQCEYLEYHNSIGNLAIVTRGIDAAIAAIDTYMGGGK